MRILILIAIALLLYLLVMSWLRKPKSAQIEGRAQKMVQCEHCGLHVPESEAIAKGSHQFCSVEHLELHTRER